MRVVVFERWGIRAGQERAPTSRVLSVRIYRKVDVGAIAATVHDRPIGVLAAVWFLAKRTT